MTSIPKCPHDPDDPQAYLTCPPCRRGDHVVPQEAKRMSIPIGRKTTMMGSQMCRGEPGDIHLIKGGETGVWNGAMWVCEECA